MIGFPRIGFIVAASALMATGTLRAQEVSAELSQQVTVMGRPVQMILTVKGGGGARVPQQIPVDGLEIRLTGKSQQINVVNFKMTVISTLAYTVNPLRTGIFTIPPIELNIGGRMFSTEPLSLTVGSSTGGVPVMPAIPVPQTRRGQPPSIAPPSALPQLPDGERQPAFGELIIPKKTAYAGEVVPVELRFYFDTSYSTRVADPPTFTGEGFTVMNFPKPGPTRQQEIDGRIYEVVTFQSAITPVKAGTLEIPAATLQAQVQVPGRMPQGMDDAFSSFFGNMMPGMEARNMEIRTKPSQLEVKALPTAGRPGEFSGAIGQFSLKSSATPKDAASGEPISLTVSVAGRGNFDGMSPPRLVEADDWKTYPPGETFRPSATDPIGYNGEKKFDFMIVARKDATLTPVGEFSFFDPAIEKYVTLKSSPVAVRAQGGGAPPPTPAAVAAAPSPTPSATAPKTPGPADELVAAVQRATFTPFFRRPVFLWVNALLGVLWGVFVVIAIVRAWSGSGAARASAQEREARKLLNRVAGSAAAPDEFFREAAEFVRVRLAPEGSASGTRDLIERAPLTGETREAIGAILDRADEVRYSGWNGASLGPDDRARVIEHLRKFDHEAGK